VASSAARRRLDADVLTTTEIEALLQQCSRRAATGIRNRAILALAWRCGLRVSEVLGLEVKDIDLDGGRVTIRHGKGDKMRIIGLDSGTAALVSQWLAARAGLRASRSAPLFTTLGGGPIDPSYLRHAVKRLARRAGIDKRVHLHGLRHAYALALDREGATPTMIRDLLGHASLATTDRYLRRLGAGEAVEFASSREWALGGPPDKRQPQN
jgi:site-specific recombinase XerD